MARTATTADVFNAIAERASSRHPRRARRSGGRRRRTRRGTAARPAGGVEAPEGAAHRRPRALSDRRPPSPVPAERTGARPVQHWLERYTAAVNEHYDRLDDYLATLQRTTSERASPTQDAHATQPSTRRPDHDHPTRQRHGHAALRPRDPHHPHLRGARRARVGRHHPAPAPAAVVGARLLPAGRVRRRLPGRRIVALPVPRHGRQRARLARHVPRHRSRRAHRDDRGVRGLPRRRVGEHDDARPKTAGVTTLRTTWCCTRRRSIRDGHVASGMEGGMQLTFDRLDDLLDAADYDRRAVPPRRRSVHRPGQRGARDGAWDEPGAVRRVDRP